MKHQKFKQKKKLSKNEIRIIESVIEKSRYKKVITQKMLKEITSLTGLNRSTLKRRATKAGINYTFGFSYDELTTKTAGKARISLLCKVCNEEYETNALSIRKRTYNEFREFCGNHYMKYVCKSATWREKNRKAQLIAQNRPDVIEKQIISQKRRHARPGVREQYQKIAKDLWKRSDYRKKQTENAKRNWENPEYAKKVFENSSKVYSGWYCGLHFQSCAELAFILYCEESNHKVVRYNLKGIKWTYDKKIKTYYPDFIINDDTIIEVKANPQCFQLGENRIKQTNLKFDALKIFCTNTKYKARLVFINKDIDSKFYKNAKELIKNGKTYKKKQDSLCRKSV